MRRLFWLALDKAGHALPLLRLGRVRYAICLRADRYYDYAADDIDMTPDEGVHRFTLAAPVEVTALATGVKVRICDSPFVITEPQRTWSNGTSTTIRYTP